MSVHAVCGFNEYVCYTDKMHESAAISYIYHQISTVVTNEQQCCVFLVMYRLLQSVYVDMYRFV